MDVSPNFRIVHICSMLKVILYCFQPISLFLKDIVLTAISLSHMGTTSVFLAVMAFLFSGLPPLRDGVQESLPCGGICDRVF